MVRSIHKINIIFIATLLIGAVAAFRFDSPVKADTSDTENVNFDVNVTEALTVSISTPVSWANGGMDTLLRNKVTVSALTNNQRGVTVSMYAENTELWNTESYTSGDSSTIIPTLADNTAANNFPVTGAWGYSINDTAAGDSSATYRPMTDYTAPVTLLESNLGSQGTQDVYFGAKASAAKQSGTYAQTVYFTAVTGTLDPSTNPADPTDPSTPSDPTDVPSYDPDTGNPATTPDTSGVIGQTTYTRRTRTGSGSSSTSGATETTTSQVSRGDTSSSYVRAAGVTSTTPTTTSSDNISTLGIALASAAGVAAVSGIFFLVAAKRRKDDDD